MTKRRLTAILPRCVDCRLHRVQQEGMVCDYCQRLRDNISQAEQHKQEYIADFGQEAWDAECQRKIAELY